MEAYPFNNILQLKVKDIFVAALQQGGESVLNHILYQTSLVKMILDLSRDKYEMEIGVCGNKVSLGYMAVVRKIANQLNELSGSDEEVKNFLESIPEWKEFWDENLSKINQVEKAPLAEETRGRGDDNDDNFDFFFKI